MAVSINNYNHFVEKFGDGHIDLDTDTHKFELYNSTHTFVATEVARSEISADALATANGYTNPGQNFAGVTWGGGATTTFDANDNTWSASGGGIGPARHCVLYDDTPTAAPVDPLMFNIDFGQDETAGDGTDFKITINASGIFTVA